jgi:RecB family exonuclease
LQSACPFRAAAELRLGAIPLGEPVSGLDARERGQFLHRALQATWERLGSSRALKGTAAPDLTALVGVAIDTALGELIRLRATELAPPLLENERQRAAVLLAALLAQEAQRADFSIATLEGDERHTLGGLPIKVRMDRLDRLDDGRLVVLDYKSGAPQAFITQDERPQQPQLLAYALLVPGELAGVAAVHLRPDAIHWRGAAAQPEVLPKLSTRGAAPSWGEQLAHWRRVIDALVQGFVSGDAAVQPRADACEQCHLAALCRIDSAGLAVVEPGEYGEGVQPRVG